MAQIDPNIILSAVQAQRSGSTPFTKLQDIMQFQNLIAEQEKRQAQQQKQQTISDLIRSNVSQTDAGIQLNQPQFIQQLSQIDPQMALQEQERINLQQAKVAQQQAQEKKMIAEADTKSLERARERGEMISSAAGAVLSAPPEQQQTILDSQLDLLIDNGVLTTEMLQGGNIPLVINPQNLQVLEGIRNSSLSAKEQVDIELENRKLTREKEVKETSAEKSAREQTELQTQLPDIIRVKKGKRVNPKTVERSQNTISFGSEMIDGIARAKQAINKLNRVGIIGKSFNPGDPEMAAVQSELRALQLLEKGPEGAQLGVLAGPDLDILDAVTGSPENMSLILKGPGATIEKLRRLEERLINKTNSKLKSWNLTPVTGGQLKTFTSESYNFDTVEQAEAAKLPAGTEITIQGRRAVVE